MIYNGFYAIKPNQTKLNQTKPKHFSFKYEKKMHLFFYPSKAKIIRILSCVTLYQVAVLKLAHMSFKMIANVHKVQCVKISYLYALFQWYQLFKILKEHKLCFYFGYFPLLTVCRWSKWNACQILMTAVISFLKRTVNATVIFTTVESVDEKENISAGVSLMFLSFFFFFFFSKTT